MVLPSVLTHREIALPTPLSGGQAARRLDRFHSIRVNKKWRLIFQWDGGKGEASGVYLDDHSYR
jgi:proteic killer suppression protein